MGINEAPELTLATEEGKKCMGAHLLARIGHRCLDIYQPWSIRRGRIRLTTKFPVRHAVSCLELNGFGWLHSANP